MTIRQHLLLCAGLFCPFILHASPPTIPAQQLSDTARALEWQSLLHYMPKSRTARRYTSQVDDPAFFFAVDGKHNPLAELRASLQAFYEPAAIDINAHPVCKKPGRWEWLQKQLNLPDGPVSIADCTEYSEWYNRLNPHKITLIFASSYLNSPSSMFGHTFMRIDPPNVELDSNWLSWALNFGAVIQADDNSMFYAYNGLFGGYPGYFTVLPYYEKIKEYSHLENRDLWEYTLNLTPEETHRLVAHLWDLKDIRFDYYFLDENCSYRLLELLEYARPGQILTSEYRFNAIPVDTVKTVVDNGFVDHVDYVPAVTTRIGYQIAQLTPQQQRLANQLALGEAALDDFTLMQQSEANQLRILRVAYHYLRYRQINKGRDDTARALSMALLKEINAREPIPDELPPTPYRPDLGHNSQMVALRTGQQDRQDFGELTIRLSYHDLNDNLPGFLAGASLNLGELSLRGGEGYRLRLQRFSAIEIQSHSPRDDFFKPITWRIQTGLEQVSRTQDNALVPQVNGGAGITYHPLNGLRAYALMTTRVEYHDEVDDRFQVALGPLVGAIAYLPTGTLSLEGQYWFFSSGEERYDWRLIKQFEVGIDQGIRVKAERHRAGALTWNEFSVEWRRYH